MTESCTHTQKYFIGLYFFLPVCFCIWLWNTAPLYRTFKKTTKTNRTKTTKHLICLQGQKHLPQSWWPTLNRNQQNVTISFIYMEIKLDNCPMPFYPLAFFPISFLLIYWLTTCQLQSLYFSEYLKWVRGRLSEAQESLSTGGLFHSTTNGRVEQSWAAMLKSS